MALTSSAVCWVRNDPGITVGTIDEDGNLIPLTEEEMAEEEAARPDDLVDCFAFPRTDLASSGLAPTGSGNLTFDDQEYVLNSAVRGIDTLPPEPVPSGESPPRSYNDIVVHNGETRVLRHVDSVGGLRIDYGVYEGSVALSFTLMTRNSEGSPAGRAYELVPNSTMDQEQSLIDQDIATDAVFLVDLDGDGTISAPELFLPVSGQVIWSDTEDSPRLTFSFVLEDGRTFEGTYGGGYELVDLGAIAID